MSDEQKYAILDLNEYIRQGEPQKRDAAGQVNDILKCDGLTDS